mgnify:CR=1 FL=1
MLVIYAFFEAQSIILDVSLLFLAGVVQDISFGIFRLRDGLLDIKILRLTRWFPLCLGLLLRLRVGMIST